MHRIVNLKTHHVQGRIQDFKLGGRARKKIAPSGGRRENCWGISCEKSRFYAKIIFDSKFTELIEVLYILYPVLNFTLKLQ